jgi:hypothetical protein
VNKIEMQMGVPAPNLSLLQKLRSSLGSFDDLKKKVKKAREELIRPNRLVRSIVEAEIDERFFPKELLFAVMQMATLVKTVSSTNVLPREIRDVIGSMRTTLKQIDQTYRSKSVAEASGEVQEEIDSLVAQFRRNMSTKLGSHVTRDLGFSDTEEHDYNVDLAFGDDPLDSVDDTRPRSARSTSSSFYDSPTAPKWRRPKSLAESLLGDHDEDDNPYAIDIGNASAFDAPVDDLTAGSSQQVNLIPSSSSLAPEEDEEDDENASTLASALLDALNQLQEHENIDTAELAESVHALIDAMNEEDGVNERGEIDASSVTP